MAVSTFTKSGNKATTAAKLDKGVFGVPPKNHELLKQAYTSYLANSRTNNAAAKTRGEISGGGRKPWRQKGTGRARFGSIRNPIWRGGGIVFGPTGNENYSHKLHVNAKRSAIRQALSLAAENNKILIIEDFEVKDGKTKSALALLNKIGATGNALVVVSDKTDSLKRATRNLDEVTLVQSNYVNVYDVLNADKIVLTNAALKAITDWLGGTK
jgi:large subunit ribosomal protein L4